MIAKYLRKNVAEAIKNLQLAYYKEYKHLKSLGKEYFLNPENENPGILATHNEWATPEQWVMSQGEADGVFELFDGDLKKLEDEWLVGMFRALPVEQQKSFILYLQTLVDQKK